MIKHIPEINSNCAQNLQVPLNRGENASGQEIFSEASFMSQSQQISMATKRSNRNSATFNSDYFLKNGLKVVNSDINNLDKKIVLFSNISHEIFEPSDRLPNIRNSRIGLMEKHNTLFSEQKKKTLSMLKKKYPMQRS